MVNDTKMGSSRRLRSCFSAVLVLLATVVAMTCVVGVFGSSRHGSIGWVAAGVAGLLCFVSSAAALLATGMLAGTPNAMSGVLVGMVLRTGVPFFVSFLLVRTSKPLADAGLLGMVLISYLVVLAVETLLAVRIVQAHSPTVAQR